MSNKIIVMNSTYSESEKALTGKASARHKKEVEKRTARTSMLQKWEEHPSWLFRASYLALHSTWASAVAISGALAWTISLLLI